MTQRARTLKRRPGVPFDNCGTWCTVDETGRVIPWPKRERETRHLLSA